MLPQDALSPTLLLAGAACAVVPDLDVVGFKFGVGSHPLWGHRGFTHSVVFAATLGTLLTCTLFRHSQPQGVIWWYLFLSTLSHPLLDMLTNGGRGVALLAPFTATRYFFPWRPIEVSPIGVRRFFSQRGLQIIRSECRWVWLPAAVVSGVGMVVRGFG